MKVRIEWESSSKWVITPHMPEGTDEVVLTLSKQSEVLDWHATGGKKVLKKDIRYSWDMKKEASK